MKTPQIKILKTYNAIIAGILTLMGFATSCEINNAKEYGTPSAKFIVNGTITAKDSNTPIKNIRVIMNRDSTTTDNDGKYQVSDRDGFPADQLFTIKFHDTDGPLNGEYENLDTVVQFKDPKFTNGDGHWYQGETTKDFNVTLNKKK